MYKNMPHIGEIVTKTIIQKGFSKTEIAEAIGLSRVNLYRQLDKADMKISYVLKIGEYIGVDFAEMIPAIKKEMVDIPDEVNEDRDDYENNKSVEPLDLMVRLDGTEETLEQLIARLTRINSSL